MKYKDSDLVCHSLSESVMIVICTTSDGMIDCRYKDNNGIYQRQCFYPFELQSLKERNEVGFGIEKPK